MPVDMEGNRADIVMDGFSTINRMNFGRLYEQYFNAASRDTAKKIRAMIGIQQGDVHAHAKVEDIFYSNRNLFDQCYNFLMGYYEIMSPKMVEWLKNTEDENKIQHLSSVIKEHIYLYVPPDTDPEFIDIVRKIENEKTEYKPCYGPVTYVGNSGKLIKTDENVRIGSMYIMLLEKTGDDWSAVSSAKLQHFGIIAQLTKGDKYSQPTRHQPVRAIGEAEARIFISYCGTEAMAELMDRNNSPVSHKEIVKNILSAPQPTNIKCVIDRSKFPFGGAKPLAITDHMLLCSGVRFSFKKDN